MNARGPRHPDPFVAAVAGAIDRHALLAPAAGAVVAVSGGADSVALLVALALLAAEARRGYRLHVAHLDHAARGGSADDARYVADLAARLELPATIERIDAAAQARPGEGFEAAARRVRYAFLDRAAADAGCEAIATAHHADDNVETVLHRIARGTGIAGLAGIPRVRTRPSLPRIIRPMLDCRRADAEAFLTARGIGWRTDPTNRQTEPTRNRIRHELLPLLRRDFNPQVDGALQRLIQTARWAQEVLDAQGARASADATVETGAGWIALDVPALRAMGSAVASLAIRSALGALGAPMRRVGLEAVRQILDLVERNRGGRLLLPDGLGAERRRRRLILRLARPDGGPPSVDNAPAP
ncbi:MAG: tRNA lysidine(34) synthetase TilS [Planctomycetes bacterium]|nr:tRNA lysidine(34) synthetase TilS [Planctomycetota bacterium]